jgi:hypothetical protein
MWPIQLVFLLCIVCRIFISFLTLCNTPFFLTWLVPLTSISSTKFWNFSGISDLFSEMSKFQLYTKLCSKCSILLVSSFNLSPIFWWKESSSCWMLCLPWQSWVEFHVCIVHHSLSCYPN